MKVCATCGESKDTAAYSTYPSGNPRKHCRSCTNVRNHTVHAPRRNPAKKRAWTLLSKYGLTQEDFDRMVAEQQGLCAICHREPRGRWNVLAVDHDHQDGHVRQLLCDPCNRTYGYFEKFREGFLDYDRRHRGAFVR